MILKPTTECESDFNFFPFKSWPKVLPAVAFCEQLVCDFHQTSEMALDLDQGSLAQVFIAVYHRLNIFELARLSQTSMDRCSLKQIVTASGFVWSDNLKCHLESIARLPRSFQYWCEAKELAPREVQIFRSFAALDLWQDSFRLFPTLGLTRQRAVEALELTGELLLLGIDPAELLPKSQHLDEWLKYLRSLRRPQALSVIDQHNDELAKIPWPKSTSGRWLRHGDQLQLEVSLKAHSKTELSMRLRELLNVKALE
jgi:hypothetical protein